MPGKFDYVDFSQIDLSDPFFSSLKQDYPEFEESWFPKGVRESRKALVFYDDEGLGAFIALKQECEPLTLQKEILPARNRLKISTLRLAERFRGQRLGEGALGLILWKWQLINAEEVYVTVFDQHPDLISQLERFGFVYAGRNANDERVYIRSKKHIDFSDPYRSFPFISPKFTKGGYLIVDDTYHDTLFPYSEVKNMTQEQLNIAAANGVSKIYIGKQWCTHYNIGDPIFIYRKSTLLGPKRYKSCLTSFGVITKVIYVKSNGHANLTFNEFCEEVKNKSIFPTSELRKRYDNDRNITMIHLLYCGYFGCGNNINMDWLDKNGLWAGPGEYPTHVQLSPVQCQKIWEQGNISMAHVFGK